MWVKTKVRNNKIMLISGLIVIFLIIYFRDDFNLNPENTVAKIDNKIIYKQEFDLFYKDFINLEIPEFKKTVLDYMIAQELIAKYAKKINIFDKITKNLKQVLLDDELSKMLAKEYFKKVIKPKLNVSNNEIKLFYQNNKLAAVYFLYISFNVPNSKNKIAKAKIMLEDGFDFFKVQKKFADDKYLGENSFAGYHIKNHDDMPKMFKNYANQLSGKGSHSQIFNNNEGYIILYQGKTPNYNMLKGDIALRLEEKKRKTILKNLYANLDKNIKINTSFINKLNSANNVTSLFNNPVATVNGKTIFFKSFYNYCTYVLNLSCDTFKNYSQLKPKLMQYLQSIALKNFAINKKLNNPKSFKLNYQIKVNKINSNLVYYVFEKILKDKNIHATEEDINNYYNNNTLYNPDLLKLKQIVFNTKSQANKVYNKLSKQKNFSAAVLKYSIEPNKKISKGVIEFKTSYELGKIYKPLNALKINQVSKPIKYNNNWVIFKLLKRQQGGKLNYQQSYNYIKTKVILQKLEQFMHKIKGEYKIKTKAYYERI